MLAGPLVLLGSELTESVRDLVLVFVAAVQVNHRGEFAVVPHALYQLAETGPGVGAQSVSGMPEITE